jgi:RHS repeat-associated protein
MVRAESVTVTLVYTYNAQGLRVTQAVDGDVTTFAWDWASGLPEMLSDGDNLYLVGHETLGTWDGATWAYHLPDALGSVRQVADGAGAVVSSREWTPFGVEVGAAQAGLGYTGEWWDAGVGLQYLRARWYEPYLNQFISPDTIVPDFRNPQSINRYAYVLGNPINYRDPSGSCLDTGFGGIYNSSEPDPRDLTDWLHSEMVTNANHPDIRKLRSWNTIAKGWGGVGILACGVGFAAGQPVIVGAGGIVIVGGTVFHGTALYEYAQLVKNGARWDVKDEVGIKLGPGITLCTSPGTCYDDIEYSVTGNVLFAYLGGAAGFYGWEIQAGAAWAEVHDPAHVEGSEEYAGPYEGETDYSPWWDPSQWNFGDEPMDHEAVTLGLSLWAKYEDKMALADFERELAGYISRLARCAPDPDPVREDIARNWPYPVGYFNNKGEVYIPPKDRCP